MDDMILRWLLRELFNAHQEIDRLRAVLRELEERSPNGAVTTPRQEEVLTP